MDSSDLELWKEIRGIRQTMFDVAMHVEGLMRALDASSPGFKEAREKHEKEAASIYSRIHYHRMNAIDDIIRKLESS